MSDEKDKATRRMVGTAALAEELQQTRTKLRALIGAGRKLFDLNIAFLTAKQRLREALDDSEKFLGIALVLIVPTLLLQ